MNKMKKVLCGFLALIMAAGGAMVPANHAEAAEQNPAASTVAVGNRDLEMETMGAIQGGTTLASSYELYNRSNGNVKDFTGAMYLERDNFSGSTTADATARYKICVDNIESIVMVSEVRQNTEWGWITRKFGIANDMTSNSFVKSTGGDTGTHLNQWTTNTYTDVLNVSELTGNYFLNINSSVKDGYFKVKQIYVKFKSAINPTDAFKVECEEIVLAGSGARTDITGGWTKGLSVTHGTNWSDPAATYSRTKNKIDLSSLGKVTMKLTSDGVMWADCWSAGGYANGTIGYHTNETNNKFLKSKSWTRNSTGQDASTKKATIVLDTSGAPEEGYLKVSLKTKGSNLKATKIFATVDKNTPPIVKQPQDQSVYDGETATFAALANYRGENISYQWYNGDGTPVTGNATAKTTILVIENCKLSDSGKEFYLVATDSNGSSLVPATKAKLTVSKALSVDRHPGNQAVNVGQTATFSVAATSHISGGILTYQWMKGKDKISGATSSTYTFIPKAEDNGTKYSCVVFVTSPLLQGGKTSKESNEATLTVYYAPEITQNPVNQTVIEGQPVSFSVAAKSGNPNDLKYQWQESADINGGNGYTNIPNATSSTYTFNPALEKNQRYYRCIVRNGRGLEAVSKPAKLTVAKKELKGIRIITPPNKTAYIKGMHFERKGMEVEAYYENSPSERIDDYEIVDGNDLKLGQTSVTIRYTEGNVTKETTQPITVRESELTKIELTTPPDKTNYFTHEDFQPEGMVVTVYYENGNSHITDDYEIVDGNDLKLGQTSVTIRYTEGNVTKETMQTITVWESELTKIELTTPLDITGYFSR